MTEPKFKPVSVPYDPEQVVNECGWIWAEKKSGHGWIMVFTFEEEDDQELMVEVLDEEMTGKDGLRECHVASQHAGTPYIPVSAPSCGPTAGAMVRVWLPGGNVMTFHSPDRDEAAQAMTKSVLALLTGGGDD